MKKIQSKFAPYILPAWWGVGVIIFVWVIFASPFLFQGLMPFPTDYLVTQFPPWSAQFQGPVKNAAMPDVITQIYPWKKLTIDTWKSGHIPLWNPYSFSGTVHAANYQSAVFSPVNVLFFIFPFNTAWSIMILLQPLLAGLFMYYYLSYFIPGRSARIIGSLAFMFCGFGVVWMAYGTLFYAALYVPLVLSAVDRQKGILLAFSIALSFLSGHFQISIYVLAVTVLYIWYFYWKNRKSAILLSVYCFLGLAIASPQLLLTFDAFKDTVRSTAFGKGEVVPWKYLITLIAPDFYGNPVTRNDWFGHYAEWASYIGVIPLFFAVKTLFSKFTRRKIFFFLLAVFSLLLAYESPLSDIFFALKIPALSTSAASRILVIFSFSLAVLSSLGFEEKSVNKKILFPILFFMFMSIVLLKSLRSESVMVAMRNSIIPAGLAITGLICMLFRKYIFVTALLLTLTAFDLLRFSGKWMPFEPAEFMYPETGVIRFLTGNAGNWRVFGNLGGEVCVTYKLQCIEGYDTMYQARYGRFIHISGDGTLKDSGRSTVQLEKRGKYAKKILDALGVKYIVHRLSDNVSPFVFPVWEYPLEITSVYKDEYYEVYENDTAYPRAFISAHEEKLGEVTVFVPEKEAHILEYYPNRITIRADVESDSNLILSDVHSLGWKASVDGIETEILRVSHDFRGVHLTAGSHEIIMVYQPPVFRLF